MPNRINIYVPTHLYKRRHEIPPEESLAGLFNDALEKRLDELDAEREGASQGAPDDGKDVE